MSAELRKRAAAGARVHSGPSEKRATTAVHGGRAPKVEPQEDPQNGHSRNDGVPANVAMNGGGAMMNRLRQELREAKKKADDAEKKRTDAVQSAERYERQAEEADRRARELEEDCVYRRGEMTRLQFEVDQLKERLELAPEGRERRMEALKAELANKLHVKWDADREHLEKQIEKLTRQIAEYKRQIKIVNQEEASSARTHNSLTTTVQAPEYILDAKLDCATELYETIKMLEGMTLHLPLKFDRDGLSITTVQPPERPTVPIIVLKLNSNFFTDYECQREFTRRVDFKRLCKALECSHADQCEISHQMGSSEICFEFEKSDTEEGITAYLKEVRGARAPRALSKVEYSVVFNANSNQLSTIAKKLSREAQSDTTAKKLPRKGIFIKAKQDKMTISTVEDYVGEPSATAYVAKVDEELADLYVFTFKVEDYVFSEPVELCVDAKYLKMCMRPCGNPQIRDKLVGFSLHKDRMQIDYTLADGSVAYYLPNVAPDPRGQRCFSPENMAYVDEEED